MSGTVEPSCTESGNVVACKQQATATIGGRVVARSSSALRVEPIDGEPSLWFPVDAVAPDLIGTTAVVEALRPELAGHLRVVELNAQCSLTERWADGSETVHRFPTWGDASHLVELMDLRPVGPMVYESAFRTWWLRPVVEASQILGQSVVAAVRHSGGRRMVSGHMVCMRVVDARAAMRFVVTELSVGKNLSTVRVDVSQFERLCASGTYLLDVTSADLVRASTDPPEIVGPDEAVAYDMGVTGRDLRIVDAAYDGDPAAPVGPPVIDAWMRYRDIPDDRAIHAGLLAQFTGHLSIAAALRPHAGIGERQAHKTLSSAINAIAISFHADVHADEWMLYRHRSTFAGDGMTHSECRVHTAGGSLIASFSVDAMVRPMASGSHRDERTAL